MVFSQYLYSQIIFKRLAKALNRPCICAGWSESMLVAHSTLLEISGRGSSHYNIVFDIEQGYVVAPNFFTAEFYKGIIGK